MISPAALDDICVRWGLNNSALMFDAGMIVFGNEMLTDCFLSIDGIGGIDAVVCAIYQVKHLRRFRCEQVCSGGLSCCD